MLNKHNFIDICTDVAKLNNQIKLFIFNLLHLIIFLEIILNKEY